jgi:hypothetical protein
MSEVTIEIPVDHVEAIRRSLLARRDAAESPDEVEDLLVQLAAAASRVGSISLSGSRSLLWSVVYDSLCSAAEQLAEDCNEYWRGTVTADSARAAATAVGTRLDLLIGLGAPPRG